MGCFPPCFGASSSKRRKHSQSANATPTAAGSQTHVANGALIPSNQLTLQKTVEKEPIDKGKGKDKDEEVNNRLLQLQEESSCSESLFSLSIGSRKHQVSAASEMAEIEVNSPIRLRGVVCTWKEEREAFGSAVRVQLQPDPLENLAQGKPFKATTGAQSSKKEAKDQNNNDYEESAARENNEEQGKARASNQPQYYRYRNCSDEGYEGVNVDESDFDATFIGDVPHGGRGEEDGDVNETWVQEESSESLFSLSLDSRKRISAADKAENEVSSAMPDRVNINITDEETEALESSQSSQGKILEVCSVLNPIENLATTQGKVVKATVGRALKNQKENINSVQDADIPIISPEPSLILSNRKARHKFSDKKQETGVDTSFSSWLVEPETTPVSNNSANSVGEHTPKRGRDSPLSHEDEPILKALTIEELIKNSTSTTSSRRARSRSPDETPIIGTVGSYWSHTGQTIDSDLSKKCGKCAKIRWSSTTLKARLESAFEASVAEV